jgi:hypothetical protein
MGWFIGIFYSGDKTMKYGFDAVSIGKSIAWVMVVAGLLFAAGCKDKPA